jgi:hypothetical protein
MRRVWSRARRLSAPTPIPIVADRWGPTSDVPGPDAQVVTDRLASYITKSLGPPHHKLTCRNRTGAARE